ncbi:MAG TPA: hypothetical protein VGB45_09200 [Abditibacterium sp.]|jgi:hypothetical protein
MHKLAFLTLFLGFCTPANAWFPQGHSIIADAATQSLPDDVPQWFRAGGAQIAHGAQDPDVQKSRDLPFMTEAEYPQHFFDYELLRGRPLPKSRADFYKLCAELKINASDVGELPYSIAERTQRLTMIFAEARRYPENPYIRAKALVEAGILSHYSGDMCMPLHVTLDHDGRALADGKSPKTGIHAKVDSLIEKLDLKSTVLAQNQKVEPFKELLPAIEAQMYDSRDKIDATYALEATLPDTKATDPNWKASPELVAFTQERARAATNFTASLFLTAWRDSEKVKLPFWLQREETTR